MKRAPSASDPYIQVARTILSEVTHWATRDGRRTLCGIRVPGFDPADTSRPYNPAWEVKTGRISLVTCARCRGGNFAKEAL